MDLLHGFSSALTLANFFYCFIGVFIGTLIGVLPGIGPVGAMALLLPSTLHISPAGSIIMLAGIYYGSQYGGSTTSILLNIPGEASSVVTCLDGYQMARQGRAGPALGIAAFGSFIAGSAGVMGVMLVAPPLAEAALRLGPPEYFTLMVLGLTIVTYLALGSISKSLMMAAMGIILGCVGIDAITAQERFTFGILELNDGVGLVPVVMGLFGISEVLLNVEESIKREIFKTHLKGLLPSRQDWRDSAKPIARGSILGFFLGILPGGGALVSSFLSYGIEKRFSKHPERFGHGAIEGVAGPESANNAASSSAMIPLLTLGIPANVVMAVLLGALLIHGLQPGPMLMARHPDFFWTIVASMYIGNVLLLVLNLPLIGMWVQVLRVPYRILFPLILLFCLVGVYAVNFSKIEILIMILFGVAGYLMKKFQYEGAPLVLAYVLGPMLESALRQSLTMADGSFTVFFTRPISAIGMVAVILLLISPILLPSIGKKRKTLQTADLSDS